MTIISQAHTELWTEEQCHRLVTKLFETNPTHTKRMGATRLRPALNELTS